MGKPIMWMFGFQNCARIVGSLIAYGVSYMNGLGGLSGWQWLAYPFCLDYKSILIVEQGVSARRLIHHLLRRHCLLYTA
jgi:hypothetical protein